eukprot:212086-Rhodomonas_salina.2
MTEITYKKVLERVRQGHQVCACVFLSVFRSVWIFFGRGGPEGDHNKKTKKQKRADSSGVAQVMVFVHSRKDTYKTAKTLMEMAQQEGTIS